MLFIKYEEFAAAALSLIDMTHPKKNCLYLYGQSSNMKSTITNSIKNAVPNPGQQITSSDFAFQECVNTNLIYAEECIRLYIISELKHIRCRVARERPK
jgi:energy-coupling factor transporter ATP-binding protein EcfA2